MNKLIVNVLMVMVQEFNCTNTCEYTNIPSCREKLVFDSYRLQERIFVNCTIKLIYWCFKYR